MATRSRGALFALVISLLLLIPRRYLVPLMACGALCGVAVLFTGEMHTILAMVGRDGSADEAVDMAGRIDLWNFTWELIGQRPLIGYGFNSFESYAGGVLWTGPVANGVASHNNYLSVLYSTGVFGMIPFLVGFFILLYRWIIQPDAPRDFFVLSALFSGYVEIDVLSSFIVVPTLIFFIVVALDARKRIPLSPEGPREVGETPLVVES
jgi:O-antigen ligase